jgi:pimeloyl-ACP methyl ester carboxylesterase
MVSRYHASQKQSVVLSLGPGLLVLYFLGVMGPSFLPWHVDLSLKPQAPRIPELRQSLADPVDAQFMQVFPSSMEGSVPQRSAGQTRAIVLIHGFGLHPFRKEVANQARFHSWQKPGSKLVGVLAGQADVFSFAYSQNVAIEEVAGLPSLAEGIRRLRMLAYGEIILIGHSAGGLVARQFVEDYPSAGVTKVIQVCTPNGGTNYAQFEPGVTKNQRAYLHSLSKEARIQAITMRAGKRIPAYIQFACVIGNGAGTGDCVVANESQWPADLQGQGIPASWRGTTHFTVMRTQSEAQHIGQLAGQFLPRWSPSQIARAKKDLRFN